MTNIINVIGVMTRVWTAKKMAKATIMIVAFKTTKHDAFSLAIKVTATLVTIVEVFSI